MTRRMLLESLIATQFSWEQWYQQFLYNALIPTTINSKQVQNKAKVKTIEANGVVVNQLMVKIGTGTGWTVPYGGTLNSIVDGVANISITGGGRLNAPTGQTLIGTHKYLVVIKTNNISGNINVYWNAQSISLDRSGNYWSKIITYTAGSNTNPYVYWSNIASGTTLELSDYMIIDLTQMFGTGNEPTSTSDNRIQKLINGGYIEYNTGTYKGTDIREFSSKDSNNVDLGTLPFIYQGNGALNSHDTMEITATEYVFTKNVGIVDLGSGNWTVWSGTSGGIFKYINNIDNKTRYATNLLLTSGSYKRYTEYYTSMPDKSFGFDGDNASQFFIRDDSFNEDREAFKTAMSGVMLYYELATPQVIRISRKRLGIVDLGSLDWNGMGASATKVNSQSSLSVATGGVNKGICAKYVYSVEATYEPPKNKTIFIHPSNKYVYLADTSFQGKTGAEIKSLLSGIYLFYETNADTTDIADTIDIEAGGTITSDSDVLPNVYFGVKCK